MTVAKRSTGMICMSADIFLDTNILVYAFDRGDPVKNRKVDEILKDIWDYQKPVAISIQVFHEFYVTMLRKGGDPRYFREVVESFMRWTVIENTRELLRDAFEVQLLFGVSFYDANIIAAAQQSGAKELWTEDLNVGQDYGGVRAFNPFV